jgi:capsule synthesis protein PGA_cap
VNKTCLILLLAALLAGCDVTPTQVAATATATALVPTQPLTPAPSALWITSGVPDVLRTAAVSWGIPLAPDPASATLQLLPRPDHDVTGAQWIYALVAPFPTILDGVTAGDVRAAWAGSSKTEFAGWTLWMTPSTQSALSTIWGAPGAVIHTASADQLVDAAWAAQPSWAIVPFESLEPRWKVLTIDGQSPVRKDFASESYALKVDFSLVGEVPTDVALPPTNRDAGKLTTVIMTGTSSLVREIAYQMEVKGIDYPGQDIGDWLRQADILHVSNETSFDPACPVPNAFENRFYCSDPKYIKLFDDVGVDVVELTGNHIMDNGSASMLFTLDLYRMHHMAYFGGGANLDDARKPFLVENHGNRIAFVGCNAGEPPEPIATDILPGANPCDWKQLSAQVGDLRRQGYLPIVTFQYKEGYSPVVMPWQSIDFHRPADAGAVIVSGSQSHVPLQMEFYKGTFIHYGLGNLFFGQMGNQPPGPGLPLQPAERYEFLDRHVFYDGRYISTELLTAMLEDYARPRPATPDERSAWLRAYFAYSGWLPFVPTPGPELTPTRYPLLDFRALPTHTPLPPSTPTP